jgi:hypothetical protein
MPESYKRHDSSETTVPLSRSDVDGLLVECKRQPTLSDAEQVECPACHGGLNQVSCLTCRGEGEVTPAAFAEFHARVDAP